MTTPDTTPRPFTLADIAAAQGVIKRTAQGWLAKAKRDHGDIGELRNGVRHFNVLERDLLISYAAAPRVVRVDPLTAPVAPPAAPTSLAKVEVLTGNHRVSAEAPMMPGQVDLAKFRGDIQVRAYQDPLAAIEAAEMLIDAAETAMIEDLNERLALLQQTQLATAKLSQRAEDLKAQQLEYRVKQDLIGIMQNTETAKLGTLLGKAEALGGVGGQ